MSLPAKAAELPGDDETPGSGGEERGKAKSKLGLNLQGLTPQIAERMNLRGGEGVLINGVKPGTPVAPRRRGRTEPRRRDPGDRPAPRSILDRLSP